MYPHLAYWVCMATNPATPVVLTGTPVDIDTWSANLSQGWNMVGVPYLNDSTITTFWLDDGESSALLKQAIYWWDTENKRYEVMESGGEFEVGRGYWMAAGDACTLTFIEPPV